MAWTGVLRSFQDVMDLFADNTGPPQNKDLRSLIQSLVGGGFSGATINGVPVALVLSTSTNANLTLFPGAFNNQQILTTGAVTAGDGGGGAYYWDSTNTSTADGALVIAVTGVTTGRWIKFI